MSCAVEIDFGIGSDSFLRMRASCECTCVMLDCGGLPFAQAARRR